VTTRTWKVGVWNGKAWVPLEEVSVSAESVGEGKMLAILGFLSDELFAAAKAEKVKRVRIDEHTTDEDRRGPQAAVNEWTEQMGAPKEITLPVPGDGTPGLRAGGVENVDGLLNALEDACAAPCSEEHVVPGGFGGTRPNWGGKDPKAVDEPEPPVAPAQAGHDEFVKTALGTVRFFTITTHGGDVITNYGTNAEGTDEEVADFVRRRWDLLAQGIRRKQAATIELQPDGRIGEDRPDLHRPSARHSMAKVAVDEPPEDAEGDLLFRWQRGNLQESMTTARPCPTRQRLIEILATEIDDLDPTTVEVRHYTYDSRIDWDTYLVTVRGNAVGMTNGDL